MYNMNNHIVKYQSNDNHTETHQFAPSTPQY